ncbi:lipopolysaccharide biosynthesis protein [Blastococcus sp. SYSU DS0619]
MSRPDTPSYPGSATSVGGTEPSVLPGRTVRLGRQFLWLTVSRFFSAGLQAFTLILLARACSVPEFALVAGFLGLAAFIQMAVDLGVSTLAVRERAADSSSGLPAACMALHTRVSSALSASTLVSLLLLGLLGDEVFLAMLPLSLWIGADRSADASSALWVADGYASRSAVSTVIRRGATLVTFVALSWIGLDAVLAFASASGSVSLVAAVIVGRSVRRSLPSGHGLSWVRLVRAGRSFWVNSAATQARNVDVALTAALVGAVEAGLYAIPARLTGPLRMVATSLATALLPAVAKARGGLQVKRLVRFSTILWLGTSAIYCGCAAVAPLVLPQVLGPEYTAAVMPLQATLIGLVAASAASLLNAFLQGLGAQRAVATVSSLTTGLFLTSVAVGALLHGALGAAIGGSIAYFAQACLLVGYLRMKIGLLHAKYDCESSS